MKHDAETVERVAKAINGPRDATHIGEEKLIEMQDYRWKNQTDKAERHIRRIEACAALSAMPPQEVSVQDAALLKARSDAINEFAANYGMKASEHVAALPNDVKRFRAIAALRALSEGKA